MPKLKFKDWKGIYTNIDENDQSFEIVRDSNNFIHRRGYLEFEPRALSSRSDMPDLSTYSGYNWEWETGIYTTLVSDGLQSDALSSYDPSVKYDVLVLVAKATEGSSTHRLVFLRELEDIQFNYWLELWKGGNLAGIDIPNWNYITNDFDGSFFTTTKEGEAFFQVENGRLKLYLPHDCFWIGRLFRWHRLATKNSWYIDRLVEPFDNSNLKVKVSGEDVSSVPAGTARTEVACATDRRLGIKFNVSTVEDGFFNEEELTLTLPVTTINTGIFILAEYEFKTSNGEVYPCPWSPQNNLPDFPDKWYFYYKYDITVPITHADLDTLLITETLANELEPQGTDWDSIATFGDFTTPFLPGGPGPYTIHNCWQISRATFEAQTWLKTAGNTVATAGWATAANKYNYSILVTAVLDEREEIIIEKYDGKVRFISTPPDNFALSISDIFYPKDINARVSRIRFYHKFVDEDDTEGTDIDYVLHKEFTLLNNTVANPLEIDPVESFFIGEYTDSGIYLSSNIGFLFNYEEPGTYEILTGFRSFVTDAGISIGLSSKDYTTVYYSTVGGGLLMSDLVYSQNRLPISGISIINAVASLDGRLGAFTPDALYVISADEISGQLVFKVDSTLEIGVKNRKDIALMQGGCVVHTRHGIYITNGLENQLVSEAIDDLIRDNYSTGQVYYNRAKHEILYKPTSSEDLYRYRLKDNVWEKINKTIDSTNVESVVVS